MATRATRSEAPATKTQVATTDPSLPAMPCLSRMLDALDYGLLLLDAQGRVLHANHAARIACADNQLLQLLARH